MCDRQEIQTKIVLWEIVAHFQWVKIVAQHKQLVVLEFLQLIKVMHPLLQRCTIRGACQILSKTCSAKYLATKLFSNAPMLKPVKKKRFRGNGKRAKNLLRPKNINQEIFQVIIMPPQQLERVSLRQAT